MRRFSFVHSSLPLAVVAGVLLPTGQLPAAVAAPAGIPLYRQAISRLETGSQVQFHRQGTFLLLAPRLQQCSQVTVSGQFQAPNRLSTTSVMCNPAGKRITYQSVSVGKATCGRSPGQAGGKWFRQTSSTGGSGAAYARLLPALAQLPAFTTRIAGVTLRVGRVRAGGTALLLPMTEERRPPPNSPAFPPVRYHGHYLGLTRQIESGTLTVAVGSDRPLRYVSVTRDDVGLRSMVVAARTTVTFRYNATGPIALPGSGCR